MNKMQLGKSLLVASGVFVSAAGCELVNTGDDNSVDTQITDDHSVNQGDAALP